MTRKSVNETSEENTLLCPIRYTLDVVGGKWKLPIICILATGQPARYSNIKRRLPGVTNMMLSQSLKELESYGIISREQYNEVPPRVEYALTEKGQSIIAPLINLAEWGAVHLSENKSCGVFCNACKAIK